MTAAEETARVETQEVLTGRVVVETSVDVVDEPVRATLDGDVVDVVRVPRDEVVTVLPEIRVDGDVTIIPVVEEVLVVEKRLVLKEELHVRRRTETRTVEVPVRLRRQTATIRREDADGIDNSEA
ncbi:DUF2382 domain-containing protein [Chthonobacter rhizosphaerae]|uniref:DUF2382 domain-containing protein n=1 Tax=Chthonobacter rhizosphaerae TaxID=2735553 RepID=UPI0031B59389